MQVFVVVWGVLFGGSGRFPLGRRVRGQRVSAAPTWKENIAFAKAQSLVVVVFSVFFFLFCCRIEEKDGLSRSLCWRALFCAVVPLLAYPPQSSSGGFLFRLAKTVVQGMWSAIEYLSQTFVGTLCSTWGFWAFSMGFLAIHKHPRGSQPVRLKCRVWSVQNDCAKELCRCRRLSSLLAESTNGFWWPVLCTVDVGHRRAGSQLYRIGAH